MRIERFQVRREVVPRIADAIHSRFPGKLLKPLAGVPVVVHALRRAREAGCDRTYRVNGPDEVPGDLTGLVGVTAGASAPEELVDAVIARLAPADGVEEVVVTEEDEYFPPPRELRELLGALDVVASAGLGVPSGGAPLRDDRRVDASTVLAGLA